MLERLIAFARIFSAREEYILISAVISVLTSGFLVYRTLIYRDPLADRIAGINARQKALREGMLAPRQRARERRQEQSISFMRRMVQGLKLLGSREAEKATARLTQAGLRSKDAIVVYFFMKVSLPIFLAGFTVLCIYVLQIINVTGTKALLLIVSAAAAGAYLPDLYVRNLRSKRVHALRKSVPDALDLLVICAEAGQSLDGALKRVASEAALFSIEMAEELTLTSVELGLMPERRQALDNLIARTDLTEIRNVVNALIQTEQYGTPLAHSLRVLANEFRQDRLTRAEEKAARLPAMLTVPMIIFILPPLFVVLLGPAIIKIMDVLSKL